MRNSSSRVKIVLQVRTHLGGLVFPKNSIPVRFKQLEESLISEEFSKMENNVQIKVCQRHQKNTTI